MDGSPRSPELGTSLSGSLSPQRTKAILRIYKESSDLGKRIGFFPESPFTTPESLRELIANAFGLRPSTRFILIDETDGSLVPIDKSLAFIESVKLEEIQEESNDSVTLSSASLLDIFSAVSTEVQPDKALQVLVCRARDFVDAELVSLFIIDEDSKYLLLVASNGDEFMLGVGADDDDDATVGPPERVPLSDAVKFAAVKTALEGKINKVGRRIAFPACETEGNILGVLEVTRRSQTRDFNDKEIREVEYLAHCAVPILHRLQSWHRMDRAENRAQSLLKVTKTFAAAKKPEEIVQLLVNEAYELLNPERVAVFLVHAQEKELEICLSKDATGKRISMASGVAGFVARTGESVNVPDAPKDARFDSNTDLQTGFKTKSVLCCPILDSNGRVIGVIQTLNKKPTSDSAMEPVPFTSDDQELLEMLTQSAGVTLQNAQLLQATEHAKITTRALLRLVQQVVAESDFMRLDHLLRSCCKQLLDCDRCVVAWLSRSDSTLRIFLDDNQSLSIPITDVNSVEASLCRAGVLANIANPSRDVAGRKLRYDERTGYRTQSLMVAPIAGGIEGPIAHILVLNKLEAESSLAHASSPPTLFNHTDTTASNQQYDQDKGSKETVSRLIRRVSRAFKAFSKEDESDLHLFCSEVEGALRVKRNLQLDFNNLVLGENEEETGAKVDTQSRRLMMLYSGFDSSPKSTGSSSRSFNSIKEKPEISGLSGRKRKQDEEVGQPQGSPIEKDVPSRCSETTEVEPLLALPEALVDENAVTVMQSDSEMEAESRTIIESSLIDVLNLDILGQSTATCRKWTLALLTSELGTLKQCGVDVVKLGCFVAEVERNYNANPFHNFYHAFSVMHVAHDLVKRTVEGKRLDPICALSIQLAALCHDLGHKGMTNSFEAATLSDLAVRYSDDAVLERYHCHIAFKLLYQEDKSNILATMTREDLSLIRKYIVEGILATDMRRHVEHVAELERIVIERRRNLLSRSGSFVLDVDFIKTPTVRSRRNSLETVNVAMAAAGTVYGSPKSVGSGASPASHHGNHHRRSSSFFSAVPESDNLKRVPNSPKNAREDLFSKPEGKSLLVRTIVHAADLSSQTLKQEFAEDWGRRITEEFTAQAGVERLKNLPVSVPVCNTELEFYKSQVFFIRQIALPLWRGVSELLPETAVRVDGLIRNADAYESKAKRLSREIREIAGDIDDPVKADFPLNSRSAESPTRSTATPSPNGLQTSTSVTSLVEMDIESPNKRKLISGRYPSNQSFDL